MQRKVLFAKIHRATVTAAKPDYVGSITIDAKLLEATGIRPNDAVEIANCDNGERLETYVIYGEPGSGAIEINGAAAHLVKPGHKVIIMHYAWMTDSEVEAHAANVAVISETENTIAQMLRYPSRMPRR